MKLALANIVRSDYTKKIYDYLESIGEDVGVIASNKVNFPIVCDTEEGFVEIAISVVKKPSDECYQERIDYQNLLKEKAEKAELKAKEDAEKKAKKAKKESE
jgi:hypothetical protein